MDPFWQCHFEMHEKLSVLPCHWSLEKESQEMSVTEASVSSCLVLPC